MTKRHEQAQPQSHLDGNRLPFFREDFASSASARWPESLPTPSTGGSDLRSILVPLDGSPMAERALPYALALARRAAATVRIAHVHSLLDSVEPWKLFHSDNLMDRERRQKEVYLQSIMRRMGRQVDQQITSIVIQSRDVGRSLCAAAAGISLVVIATHGRGPIGRLMHGSTSHTLLRELRCPLLVVRGNGSTVDWTDGAMPRRVLIPLDGTGFSEAVVDSAATIGRLTNAHFTLAHFHDIERISIRSGLEDPYGYLREASKRFRKLLPKLGTEVVNSDQPVATSILSAAEELRVDMIALATHGRRGLARLVHGSIADSIVRRANTPVLLFRPSTQEAEAQHFLSAQSSLLAG